MPCTPTTSPGLIIGNGPVACIAALALHHAGYPVAIQGSFDTSPRPEPVVPERAIALNPASWELLSAIGAVSPSDMPEGTTPLRAMAIRVAAPVMPAVAANHLFSATNWMHLTPQRVGQPHMGYLVPYRALVAHLRARVQAMGIPILADGLADTSCRPWTVFAAGKHHLEDPVSPWPFQWISQNQDAAWVAHLQLAHPHHGVARQCFAGSHVVALLPLADPHQANLIWSGPRHVIPTPPETDHQPACLEQLSDYLDIPCPRLIAPGIHYPLNRFIVTQWHRGNQVLMGDSAHSIHPLAGQGLNLGIADVRYFMRALPSAHAPYSPSAVQQGLIRYARQAKVHAQDWLAITEGLQTGFATTYIPQRLKNSLLQAADQLPGISAWIKSAVIRYAMGLDLP